jgi:hypothetical protein
LVTTDRLNGNGLLTAPGLALPVSYTLVLTLGGRRRAAVGVVEAPEARLEAAIRARALRLRLEDGSEVAVALHRKVSAGPVLIRSIGSLRGLAGAR